jgi:4-hydroxybenzoate polyprenyltransferase
VFAIMATVCCWAAFGYCVNDVADRSSDMRAGKLNRAANVSTRAWALFLALTAGISLSLALFWAAGLASLGYIFAGLLLACAYSLPPFRIKERGILGLATGAASQWVLPVFAIAAANPAAWTHPAAWCIALLGLAIGVRWMAIHQMQDVIADRRSGVRTYASGGRSIWPVLLGAFTAEMFLLGAALLLTWPKSIPAVAALAFWMVQQKLLRPHGERLRHKLESYDHAPLAEYYFLLFPFSLALAASLGSPLFLLAAAIFPALGWCYVGMMVGEWRETWSGGTHFS